MANSKRQCSLKSCKEYFRPETGIIVCGGKLAFCCFDHQVQYGLEMGKKLRAKQKVIEKREDTRRKKEFYENDPSHQKELTRRVFNEMICLLDAGQPCISCGKFVCGSRMEAGHFKSVGSHPELRFEPLNVYLQGSGCNSATSGRKRSNLTVSKEYEQRLILVRGQELVDWLNGPHSPKRYTCAELIQMRAVFAAERTRLKKGLPPSRNWREIPQAEQMRGAA